MCLSYCISWLVPNAVFEHRNQLRPQHHAVEAHFGHKVFWVGLDLVVSVVDLHRVICAPKRNRNLILH